MLKAPKNWKLEKLKKVGELTPKKGVIKTYRSNPSDLNAAAVAAVHYAIKNNSPMIVIEGNSYMNKCYSIQRLSDDPLRVTVMSGVFNVVIADPNGNVYTATISK